MPDTGIVVCASNLPRGLDYFNSDSTLLGN